MHLTLGILRTSQATSHAVAFFWLDGFAVPAPAQVTQSVRRFLSNIFGSWLYNKVGCKIWGDPYPKEQSLKLSHAKQRALIREQSPENFVFIHTWKVLKTMSHNLSFAMLLIASVSLFRYTQIQNTQWIVITIFSVVLAIVFLKRASVYDKWHYKEMLETVEILQLEKRANARLPEKRKSVIVKNA